MNLPFPPGSRVLVTGATGFTGVALMKKLGAMGLELRAIVRPSSSREELRELKVKWFEGNVFDSETVRQATENVEYIFHVAAAYREAKITEADYRNVHVESTKLLARAALESPSFKRFIHVSTVGVHGHIENPPADETYRFHPGDIYQDTKAEAEMWLRTFAQSHQLPYTVIRPAAIYGPGDQRLLKIFKMASKRFFPVLGSGKGLYHLIHVDDLTEILITAATHPNAEGEAFIAGNPAANQLLEIATIISRAYGKDRLRVLRLPVLPFYAAGWLCEKICPPLGIEPPIYRRRVAFYTKDRSFNTRKLRERLGYTMRYTSERGLTETAQWYLQHGQVILPDKPDQTQQPKVARTGGGCPFMGASRNDSDSRSVTANGATSGKHHG